MAEPGGTPRATREAVQPSLWDRLVNDLPGVASEIDGLAPGAGAASSARSGSRRCSPAAPRAIEADAEPDRRRRSERLHRLMLQERQRAELEARGIVVSADVLREAVRRDIEALFNTERFESMPLLTDREAEVGDRRPARRSTTFPRCGAASSTTACRPSPAARARDFDREALARELKAVLAAFEPRLKESATKVTVTTGDKTQGLRSRSTACSS